MSIVTRRRADKFAIVPNAVAEDVRLSFEARGVLCYLLAKPNDWSVNVGDIQNAGSIGRDKVYRILNELLEAGYLTRTLKRDLAGRLMETEYVVFDEPVIEACPLPCFPDTAEPDTGKPDTENTDHIIRTNSNKEPKEIRTHQARVRDGGFEEWWEAYPHKVAKADAKRAFDKALRKAPNQTLLDGVRRYIASKPHDRAYCNPATWLNGERWLDQPTSLTLIPPQGRSQTTSVSGFAREQLARREQQRSTDHAITSA